MNYVVKVDDEKVRMFCDLMTARVWAKKYCRGKVTIVPLCEAPLPRAENRRFHPNLDLRYKPFVSLG